MTVTIVLVTVTMIVTTETVTVTTVTVTMTMTVIVTMTVTVTPNDRTAAKAEGGMPGSPVADEVPPPSPRLLCPIMHPPILRIP